jgi:hypothetical protein
MKTFDKKFGLSLIESIPTSPGVYRYFGDDGALIYVGKAKNLRRRLSQYRNAKRLKKDKKMRSIIRHAARLEFEVCANELEACLLETTLIQSHRPKWNIAGAFSFLYPLIGVKIEQNQVRFCYTTRPMADEFQGFGFHGAYRSRLITREGFLGLMALVKYIGHPVKMKREARVRYSHHFAFRQLSSDWVRDLDLFWKGESRAALEELTLALLEKASARSRRDEVQDHLNALKRFWKHEAQPLAEARAITGFQEYPVPQLQRDHLFLKRRHKSQVLVLQNTAV